jgi:uncharacterized lipoprotein YmbA
MITRRSTTGMMTFCVTLFLLAGCSRSPRVTFYTLNTVAPAEKLAPAHISVTVGSVTLPGLVDQPQLVVRTGINQVDILEIHRWAEPLRGEVPRIIAADLMLLLPQSLVSIYPQNAGLDADYRVHVDIQRFEFSVTDGASLDALWSVRRIGGDSPKKIGHTVVSEPAGAVGYDALVAAQSRALAAVSLDIAQALRAEAVALR